MIFLVKLDIYEGMDMMQNISMLKSAINIDVRQNVMSKPELVSTNDNPSKP